MDTIPAETLETLSQLFLHSLSPLAEHRRHAEAKLSDAGDSPFFSLALLRLLSAPAADPQVRLAAAIHLKNLLRSRYPSLPDPERAHLKSLLPSLMLASPPRIQPQLSESLSIVSSHDFPHQWPTLLPDLVMNLRKAAEATDYAAINGVLAAANSIFSKFRHSFDTNDLRRDLKYCLEHFAAPLLEVFLKTAALIAAGNHAAPLFESQRLCCEVFYALNSIELPEFFEDHMKEWMGEFLVYLSTTYAGNVEAEGVVDSLRAAVCNNLQLYMEKNEEDFRPYLAGFATAVYNLLTNAPTATASPSRDELIITAIKFLTTVSTSVHHSLFGSGDVLQQICGSIVFPNLKLKDEDEELFEMNFIEYIRRDIEGSDIDTRRRIVCELLRGLAMNYRDQVTQLVSGQIQHMLAAYAANPNENWKEKDCAIYLVVSLGAKPAAGGAQLVDVNSFFANVIVPELQGADVNAFPMLKAGALKFLTAFREQIPKNAAVGLLPHVIGLLRAESNVVHSYAANCIERLLLVKDKVQTGPNVVIVRPRYNAIDVDPYLSQLITNLSAALKFPESQENQYVMKCIMRVLMVATIGDAAAKFCIDALASVLVEVCKNPKSPTFNHYLFEAIAALVGRSCEKDPLLIGVFEAKLFPVLQNILVNDISEFWPYAFQIFAQLVEMSRPPLSENYMQIFQLLLSPESWTRAANVPALVRLLQAYLQKIPNELSNEGRLSQVLGIFHKLLTTPNREDLGFYVLNTVVENLSYSMIAPHIGQIWSALFFRLQGKRNVKIVNCLVIFMSLVLVKHGPTVLVDSINAVQPNIFATILQQFWIPNLKLISGPTEVKLTSVASTRLICESPSLLDPVAVELWGKMLDSIIALLAQPEKNGVDLEADVPEIPENTGYSASFARLQNAGKKEEDPLKEIKDPKGFLVISLAKLSSVSPGRYPVIIEQYVDPANRAVLVQLCGAYNCTIV